MSATNTPNTLALTNTVINDARTGAGPAIAALQTANPALYALLLGSGGTYGRAFIAPVVGAVVGWAVAHWALGCSGTATAGCWTPDTVNAITEIVTTGCGGLAALVMHWISKSPARAIVNAPPGLQAPIPLKG